MIIDHKTIYLLSGSRHGHPSLPIIQIEQPPRHIRNSLISHKDEMNTLMQAVETNGETYKSMV